MAILANELRIGNLVNDNTPLGVKLIAQIDRPSDLDVCHRFDPIPLTPEILEKCGFIESNDDGLYQHKDCELFQLQYNYLGGTGYSHVWDAAFTGIVIEHLHHLQNKFYFDTGTELEIKL